ncbi:uncharacterized protein [Macrobrachium rosenbergii]|uniref:uncharacterized protein n=1 Tax=Macrobrachium rosenbergii TaxID=79674 RepID=UPI0034D70E87
MKQKFGRPGVSGRKRTLQPLSDNELHKRHRPQYVGEDDSDVGQLADDAVTIRKHTDWLKREAGRQQLDKDGINHRLKKIKPSGGNFLKSIVLLMDYRSTQYCAIGLGLLVSHSCNMA